MRNFFLFVFAAMFALAMTGTARADVVTYNSTPTNGWFFGTGNDYTPANTAVLTTDAGDELSLRMHETFQWAPASVGNVYSFPLGLPFISFDWGIYTLGSYDGLAAELFISNRAGGSFLYDPLSPGNDNELLNGSVQNSARLNWFSPSLGFDPNVNGTYDISLTVTGLENGTAWKSLNVVAVVGDGFQGAIPEPATWAMLIVGFGLVGASMRRQSRHGLAVTA